MSVGGERKVLEEEEEERKKNNNRCSLAVQKNAATVHKMGHYPSTVYHYVVDKSMSLTVMILCYSKHKALRQSPCLLWRLQQGSTRGKGAHSQEGCVCMCVCLCQCVTERVFIEHICVLCACVCRCGCEHLMTLTIHDIDHILYESYILLLRLNMNIN